jgi:hypothetical protein
MSKYLLSATGSVELALGAACVAMSGSALLFRTDDHFLAGAVFVVGATLLYKGWQTHGQHQRELEAKDPWRACHRCGKTIFSGDPHMEDEKVNWFHSNCYGERVREMTHLDPNNILVRVIRREQRAKDSHPMVVIEKFDGTIRRKNAGPFDLGLYTELPHRDANRE